MRACSARGKISQYTMLRVVSVKVLKALPCRRLGVWAIFQLRRRVRHGFCAYDVASLAKAWRKRRMDAAHVKRRRAREHKGRAGRRRRAGEEKGGRAREERVGFVRLHLCEDAPS